MNRRDAPPQLMNVHLKTIFKMHNKHTILLTSRLMESRINKRLKRPNKLSQKPLQLLKNSKKQPQSIPETQPNLLNSTQEEDFTTLSINLQRMKTTMA